MRWISDNVVSRLREAVDQPDLSETKYRIIEKIARGGMGTVYLADDIDLGRKVALKVMNVVDDSGDLASRMMNEARILARLEHPAIVPVHDVGILPDRRIFYTMKYVQGDRLDQYALRGTSLPELLRTFQKVCDAVGFAHAHGVIHRDLKPENIMVGSFGEVQVMDWGIAKALVDGGNPGNESYPEKSFQPGEVVSIPSDAEFKDTISPNPMMSIQKNTQSGTIIGTPAYMSPEQARGEIDKIDERSDVYSLGGILYFLLTGRPPFEAASLEEIQNNILHREPVRPRQVNRKIKRPLDAICRKAIHKVPEERYNSVLALASDIAAYLDGRPFAAYRENLFERIARWISKNRFLVILILAYLLMRIMVLIWARR
jgi:eukaryotic-like serine/threonine-protein kinase